MYITRDGFIKLPQSKLLHGDALFLCLQASGHHSPPHCPLCETRWCLVFTIYDRRVVDQLTPQVIVTIDKQLINFCISSLTPGDSKTPFLDALSGLSHIDLKLLNT